MGGNAGARQRIARSALTESSMARTLRRTLPRRNCVGIIDYPGILGEARHFGILTNGQFRRLMLKHRRALIEADREPLTPQLEKIYRADFGDERVTDSVRRQYWFSWEALTRLALEFEFGDKYRAFADHRDGLTSGSSDHGQVASISQGEGG